MRILHLCDIKYWNHKMDRNRFHSIEALGRHKDIELIKSGIGWLDFKNVKQITDKYNPDLIIWYKPLDMPGYNMIENIPRCLRYNEMWDKEWTDTEILKSGSTLIVCHHENDIKNYLDLSNIKLYHNPHCAEKTIFKDYKEEKIYDVLLVGAIREDVYPLRYRFVNIIKKLNEDGLRCKILKHPGYNIDNINDEVIDFAKEVNRSKIILTCSSKYKYALSKFAEIPLCNSLLVSDIPNENQEWYKKWIIEINETMDDASIISLIKYYIENEGYRKEKIKLGLEMNLKDRTQESYAQKTIDIIKDYFKNK